MNVHVPEHRSIRASARMATLLACLLMLGVAPGAAAQTAAAAPAPGRVLVLPFADVRHVGRIYWMSEGAAVLLGKDLARLDQPVVPREDRRRAFEQLQIPLNVELTDATAIRIARLVGATRIIRGTLQLDDQGDGSVAKAGETLVARVRQLHIDTGRMDTPVAVRAPLEDIFSLCARMAQALAPHATISEATLVANHPPLDAFQDYIKGLLAQDPATRVRYLRSSIALDPSLDRARLALWGVYSEQGQDDRALAVAREVTEDSGLETQARFRAALSLIRLKRYADAGSTLTALSHDTPAAAILNDLGIVQLRSAASGDLKRAAYYFTEATKAGPDHADYFFNLGYTYWLQHDAHAAIYWLREAVRRHPADGAAHFVLAVALSASGEQAQAERERELAGQLSSEYADRIRKAAPGMPVVPRGLARIDTALGGPPDVSGVLSDSRQEDRDATAAFYLDRAQRLVTEHDDRSAIAALKRCLFLSPYDADAQLLLGQIYLRLRRTKEAISVLKISLWSEETADAHAALAQAYLQAGNRDGARSEATRALALDPTVDGARAVLERLKTTAKPSPKRGEAPRRP